MVSTPALFGDTVYFGSFNYRLYALDQQNASIQWTVELSNWLFGSPLVIEDAGLLIAADLDGKVFAVDLESGEQAWSFQADGPVVGTPVLTEEEGEEVIYFTSGDTHLYVLIVTDGKPARPPVEIENTFSTKFLILPVGEDVRPVPIYAPPVLFQDDTILIGSHQGTNMLIALDRETLIPTWTYAPN
jgi:outer membrane protein assembly factor BamB